MIVLDVEMPRMDGLTFLRKLMRQHPLPVVLCTTQAERAVTALEMGAIEVIAKPDWTNADRLAEWSQNLLESIRNAARAGRLPLREDRPPARPTGAIRPTRSCPSIAYSPHAGTSERIIVVGISTGGVQALQQLLAGFPRRPARGSSSCSTCRRTSSRRSPSGWTTTRGSSWKSPRRGNTSRSGRAGPW